MSETPRSENPEDVEVVIKETITKWQQKMPDYIYDWWKKKEGEGASPEELFRYYDESVEELRSDEKRVGNFKRDILEGSNTNNFHLLFMPNLCDDIIAGKMETFGIRPFYINSRFGNTWNKMCSQFYDDVRAIIQFEENGYGRRKLDDKERESLKNSQFI